MTKRLENQEKQWKLGLIPVQNSRLCLKGTSNDNDTSFQTPFYDAEQKLHLLQTTATTRCT